MWMGLCYFVLIIVGGGGVLPQGPVVSWGGLGGSGRTGVSRGGLAAGVL